MHYFKPKQDVYWGNDRVGKDSVFERCVESILRCSKMREAPTSQSKFASFSCMICWEKEPIDQSHPNLLLAHPQPRNMNMFRSPKLQCCIRKLSQFWAFSDTVFCFLFPYLHYYNKYCWSIFSKNVNYGQFISTTNWIYVRNKSRIQIINKAPYYDT